MGPNDHIGAVMKQKRQQLFFSDVERVRKYSTQVKVKVPLHS